ncbi:zinc finger, CCHC-type containing protein [Tanacetum coccineum]
MFRNPFSSTTIGDENPIRTLGDYSKPSHEGYRNTIELPVGNNVVPLRSDTIRLVQNGCSFHGLRSEDPNQHLKNFLKLVDSLDLDGDNRERTCLRLFQFSLRDQASNWLERLPAGSITTWEDLTTRFLAQFFPPGRTTKLRNDILMFQQHHGESLSEAWTPGGRLRKLSPAEAWATIKRVAQYEEEGWNVAFAPEEMSFNYENHDVEKKGIKSPSKLFSPKYLSPASIKELNKNSSAPKRVHFVNSIVVLSKDSNTEEEDVSSTNAREHDLKSMVRRKEEAKEQCKEDDEIGTAKEVEELFEDEESERETKEEVKEVFDDKTKEEEDDDTKYYNSPTAVKELVYHEWLLENPQPS